MVSKAKQSMRRDLEFRNVQIFNVQIINVQIINEDFDISSES